MRKRPRKKPELRVLPGDVEAERLDTPTRIEPDSPEPVRRNGDEPVEVLQVDRVGKVKKSLQPDVGEILNREEEETDFEDEWGASQKKAPAPVGWLVLAGVVVCGLVLWAAVGVFKAQPEREEVAEEKKELVLDKIEDEKEVKRTLEAMTSAVKGYLGAGTAGEKLAYVRHPERVKPLMVRHYRRHGLEAEEFLRFEYIRPLGLRSQPFVYGKCELEDGGSHKLLLEQMEDGTFKVDWESDVCYLPVDWTDFIRERPVEPVEMRVYVQRDNFFAYEFRDESKFDCYSLTTRDYEGSLFGYVEKGSKVAKEIRRHLSKAVKGGGIRLPCMLKLRFPEGGNAKDAVVIESLVMPRWTFAESPEQPEGGQE